MDSNFSKFVGLIAGILFTIFQGVAGSHHTVSREVSANQSLYSDWGHGSTFVVGDTIVFRMDEDIARVMSKSEYEACSAEGSKALIYRGGEGIELNTSGSWYFMSRIPDRCKSGEKVMIRVLAGGSVMRKHSLRSGRGGGSGGGGGGSGGGGGGNSGGGGSGSSSGNPGGLTTPRGNRNHPQQKNAASNLTTPFIDLKLFVLFMLCLIFFSPIRNMELYVVLYKL